jgi:hypothetical protein
VLEKQGAESLVTRQKIAGIMQEFINLESNAEKETEEKGKRASGNCRDNAGIWFHT